jgi:uncharacterized integral membrane protein
MTVSKSTAQQLILLAVLLLVFGAKTTGAAPFVLPLLISIAPLVILIIWASAVNRHLCEIRDELRMLREERRAATRMGSEHASPQSE